MPDGPSDDRRLDDVLNIITTLARLSIDGGYIFRGEPKHYDRVASRLYRELPAGTDGIGTIPARVGRPGKSK